MGKPDFANEPWRWNRWFASEYDSEATNIADDFYELDKTCDYALLSAQYMVKNKNGKSPDPCFSVTEIMAASKKPEFQVDPCAIVIDACWQSYKRWKLNDAPVILPPPPEAPKTLPKPDPWAAHPQMPQKPEAKLKDSLPEIKLPQEKKNPNPTLVKFSVWFGILSTIVGAVTWFFPVIKPWVLVIVPVIEAILKGFGV